VIELDLLYSMTCQTETYTSISLPRTYSLCCSNSSNDDGMFCAAAANLQSTMACRTFRCMHKPFHLTHCDRLGKFDQDHVHCAHVDQLGGRQPRPCNGRTEISGIPSHACTPTTTRQSQTGAEIVKDLLSRATGRTYILKWGLGAIGS